MSTQAAASSLPARRTLARKGRGGRDRPSVGWRYNGVGDLGIARHRLGTVNIKSGHPFGSTRASLGPGACSSHVPGAYCVQMLLSRKAVSCDFDSAPTFIASILPFLKSISVGIPRMPYLRGTS
jgi:hypothetical protein